MAVPKPTTKYAKRRTPSAGAMRTADDQLTAIDTGNDGEDGASTKRQKIKDALAIMVNDRIRESVMEREISGIEDEWREADDLYNGFDDVNAPTQMMRIRDKNSAPRSKGSSAGAQSTLLVNITKPKTKVAVSRIKEMLVPNNDKPWDMKPTPIPEFDEVLTNPDMASQNVTLADGSQAPALAVAEIARDKASKATQGEADWVEDRFIEGSVYAEMRRAIEDAGRIGTGVLKGPVPMCRKTRKWEVDGTTARVKISDKVEPTSIRIRPQDCYPDPACGDSIHDGSYFNEREFATVRQLLALQDDPDYDREAIANAILEGPMSQAMLRESGTKARKSSGDTRREASLFTLWHSYGYVTPEALEAMGVSDKMLGIGVDAYKAANDEPDAEDAEEAFDPKRKSRQLSHEQEQALASVPAIVTMLNGRPIRAVIQPLESGEFPFDFFRVEKVEGQPWGRGYPMQMRAAQLMVKQSIRRMLENAGLSAGQQVVITEGAVVPADGNYSIEGRKLWKFIPNELVDDVRKAMLCFDIPSKQKELLEIINFGLDMADRLTNLPMLMQGDQQAGAAPETLGGLKMFENNAMSPLRDVAKTFDDDLVIPHLRRYHEWFMTHVPDMPKGDSEINARGSTALIAREEGRQFLLMLAPVKNDPAWRIDPEKYDKELARANNYDMSLVQYTDDEWKAKQKEMAQQQPPVSDAVQVAQIRAKVETDKAGAQHLEGMTAEKARQVHEENDRALRRDELEIQREIAMLTLSAKTGESLDKIKAQLAIAATKSQDERAEIALKLSPENRSGTGI